MLLVLMRLVVHMFSFISVVMLLLLLITIVGGTQLLEEVFEVDSLCMQDFFVEVSEKQQFFLSKLILKVKIRVRSVV